MSSRLPTFPEDAIATRAREIEIAENVEAVVEADNDDVATTREVFTFVGLEFLARACGEAATVEPNHDRAFAIVVDGGSPDVDTETVFTWLAVVPFEHEGGLVAIPTGAYGLRRDFAVIERAANAGPRRRFGGRHETSRAGGSGGVGNAFEDVNAVVGVTADFSCGGFDDVGFSSDGGEVCCEEPAGGLAAVAFVVVAASNVAAPWSQVRRFVELVIYRIRSWLMSLS